MTLNIRYRQQLKKPMWSWHILFMALAFLISTVLQLFTAVIAPTAARAATDVSGLAIGTYNVLGYYHGDGTNFANDRLQQIVKNINTMSYDVVGLQEYRDGKTGDPKKFEKELQKLNSAWRISYGKDSPGYDGDQIPIAYNSSSVALNKEMTIKTITSADRCGGGSPSGSIAAHIAFFTTLKDQEFLVINVHPTAKHHASKCDTERLGVVKGALNHPEVVKYTGGPIFMVGDFNANPNGDRRDEGNIERYMKASGFGNARDIPGANKRTGGNIDHIYYKTSTIDAPGSYETMDCKPISSGDPSKYTSSTTCASDHTPVKAVFDSLSGGGSSCSNGGLEEGVAHQYQEWGIGKYGNECVCTEGGGSMSGDTNFAKIATYFSGKGLKDIAIAGILANLKNESNLTPFAVQGQPKNTPDDREPPSGSGYGIAQFTPATKIAKELNKNTQTSEYYKQYYSTKYGGYAIKPWNEGGTGIPEGVSVEVNDAWLKAQLDFFYKGEMQSTKVGTYRKIGGDMDATRKYDTEYSTSYISGSNTILQALNAAKNEKDAARIFVWIYERPADKPGAAAGREKLATEMLAPLQDIIGSGVPTTAAGNSCGSSGETGDFAETVAAFAWEDGRRGSTQKGGTNGPYAKVIKQSKYGNDAAHKYGNDCGAFVYNLMVTSGFEPNYPPTYTGGQEPWLKKNWEDIFKGNPVDVGRLEPGDVGIIAGSHVFVWIGDIEDFQGKSAEAANGSNTAPTAILASNTYSAPSKYTWYRKKATDAN